MEPSGKKGVFVGYNESSKAYKIYVLGQRHIDVSKDVTFHEEAAFRRSKELQFDINMEEHENPSIEIIVHESPQLNTKGRIMMIY